MLCTGGPILTLSYYVCLSLRFQSNSLHSSRSLAELYCVIFSISEADKVGLNMCVRNKGRIFT
jgi:hypothetical protein